MLMLSRREVRGAIVVEVQGKLIGGLENSDNFHSFFKSVLADGKNKVVINLRCTSWANSQGIGMLIGAYTSVKNAGGELVLARVGDRIHDILKVTRLLLIFKVFETEKEAVDYLTNGPKGARVGNAERTALPADRWPFHGLGPRAG
jgi:anti-sigma B factor antagonist